MINAFEMLGATPNDNAKKLQELLEEKELFLDETGEIENIYSELINPKKRLLHEIEYFSKEALSDFNDLITDSLPSPVTRAKIAKIVVNLGLWFDQTKNNLFDKINTARLNSGFTQLNDETVISSAVIELEQQCEQSINTYLDELTEDSLVGVFNQIVKIENYESFFSDKLISRYELMIKETLQQKQKTCKVLFDEIEDAGNRFNKGENLHCFFDDKINKFCRALVSWDAYAQPLQVNMQKRGGEDETSKELVLNIRSRVITLCNESQESLGKMLNSLSNIHSGGYTNYYLLLELKETLPKKLSDSLIFIHAIIRLINNLCSVFAELELTTEQLKKDQSALIDLRNHISSLNKDIQSAKKQAEESRQARYSSSKSYSSSNYCCDCCDDCCDGCYIATCVYGSYDCPEVWTLRRYRDIKLGATWYGRLFIKLYYAISPTIVKIFGKTKIFKLLWKKYLDKKVSRLNYKGFDNTPYKDKNWRKNN